jgi:hypothetical protein
MKTKICIKCKEEKSIDEFYKRKDIPDEYRNDCKKCKLNNTKKWRFENKEKVKNLGLNYRKNNKNKISNNEKKWRFENKERITETKRKYREENKEKIHKNHILYFNKNKDEIYLRRNIWRENNRDKEKLYRRNHLEYYNTYVKNRRKSDVLYRLSSNVRSRIRGFFKSKKIIKNGSTFNIVGCSPQFLREYIEKQFTDGMNWDNYGYYGWHIDHRMPLDSAKTEDELYKLCHYTNLQPLWWLDNIQKSTKII